jgi:thiamine biosynthesis lipoprotein
MRQVEHIMGIPISIDIPDTTDDAIFNAAFSRLHTIDQVFSTYKPESEISRYRRGELHDQELSSEVRRVKQACQDFENKTAGYFSAYYDGTFDPTGYVKGWAIREAVDILEKHGIHTYLVNAAGDILAASSDEKTWNIALQDPFKRTGSLGTISLKNGAIATSGTYERGNHIINPRTRRVASSTVSATVYGTDIITADVFATTCIAMDAAQAIDFINLQSGYEALLIDSHGLTLASQNFSGV